jgi:flagellar biosynthesis protein FlhF
MIVKSYTAPTVAAALKKIREEMGGNAVVLNTRICSDEDSGLIEDRVEVTACIDETVADLRKLKKNKTKDKTPPKDTNSDHHDNLSDSQDVESTNVSALSRIEKTLNHILNTHRTSEVLQKIDERLEFVFLNLMDADIPVEIAHRICQDITDNIDSETNIEQLAFDKLKDELETVISDGIRIQPGTKIAFVGPSGAGKSSVMAKFAAQLMMQSGYKTKLVSLENMKATIEDNIDMDDDTFDLSAISSAVSQDNPEDDTILLIDTPSISLGGNKSDLPEKLNSIRPNILFFIFSACARSLDLIDSVNLYESFAPSYLIATHLDETDRWGGIFAMSEYLNTPVAFITDASGVSGQLMTPDPAIIAGRLLKIG